jgi:hypothetical protein
MIVNAISLKIGVAVIIVAAAGGSVLALHRYGSSSTVVPASVIAVVLPDSIHTADWYVTHPDVLKQDEGRCAGDAGTISQASCQNVASADDQIGILEMHSAAAQDGSSIKSGN